MERLGIDRKTKDLYAKDDLRVMGHLFEFSDRYAMREFSQVISRVKFIDVFMNSFIRTQMDIYHPRPMGQAAVDTFKDFVEWDLKGNFESILLDKDEADGFNEMGFFWIGQMYAYIRYKTDIPCSEIYKKLDLDTMCNIYIWGHQMSFGGAYRRMCELYLEEFGKELF